MTSQKLPKPFCSAGQSWLLRQKSKTKQTKKCRFFSMMSKRIDVTEIFTEAFFYLVLQPWHELSPLFMFMIVLAKNRWRVQVDFYHFDVFPNHFSIMTWNNWSFSWNLGSISYLFDFLLQFYCWIYYISTLLILPKK